MGSAWHNCPVTTGSPLLVHDAIVALDYGQFYLCGSYGPSADYQTYLEQALHGDRIAGNQHAVVVCSPHPPMWDPHRSVDQNEANVT
jgi:hypothetical protein